MKQKLPDNDNYCTLDCLGVSGLTLFSVYHQQKPSQGEKGKVFVESRSPIFALGNNSFTLTIL